MNRKQRKANKIPDGFSVMNETKAKQIKANEIPDDFSSFARLVSIII